MYLISRAELFRSLGLDGQRTLLIIGAEEHFLKWIDIGIGERTTVSVSIPDTGSFDVILFCPGAAILTSDMARMERLLAPGGTLWAIGHGPTDKWTVSEPLRTDRHIVRLI
jgi:hypothetical protein